MTKGAVSSTRVVADGEGLDVREPAPGPVPDVRRAVYLLLSALLLFSVTPFVAMAQQPRFVLLYVDEANVGDDRVDRLMVIDSISPTPRVLRSSYCGFYTIGLSDNGEYACAEHSRDDVDRWVPTIEFMRTAGGSPITVYEGDDSHEAECPRLNENGTLMSYSLAEDLGTGLQGSDCRGEIRTVSINLGSWPPTFVTTTVLRVEPPQRSPTWDSWAEIWDHSLSSNGRYIAALTDEDMQGSSPSWWRNYTQRLMRIDLSSREQMVLTSSYWSAGVGSTAGLSTADVIGVSDGGLVAATVYDDTSYFHTCWLFSPPSEPELLTQSPRNASVLGLSRDGRTVLAWVSEPNSNFDVSLKVFSLDSHEEKEIPLAQGEEFSVQDATLSPDGRFVAISYEAFPSGWTVHVVDTTNLSAPPTVIATEVQLAYSFYDRMKFTAVGGSPPFPLQITATPPTIAAGGIPNATHRSSLQITGRPGESVTFEISGGRGLSTPATLSMGQGTLDTTGTLTVGLTSSDLAETATVIVRSAGGTAQCQVAFVAPELAVIPVLQPKCGPNQEILATAKVRLTLPADGRVVPGHPVEVTSLDAAGRCTAVPLTIEVTPTTGITDEKGESVVTSIVTTEATFRLTAVDQAAYSADGQHPTTTSAELKALASDGVQITTTWTVDVLMPGEAIQLSARAFDSGADCTGATTEHIDLGPLEAQWTVHGKPGVVELAPSVGSSVTVTGVSEGEAKIVATATNCFGTRIRSTPFGVRVGRSAVRITKIERVLPDGDTQDPEGNPLLGYDVDSGLRVTVENSGETRAYAIFQNEVGPVFRIIRGAAVTREPLRPPAAVATAAVSPSSSRGSAVGRAQAPAAGTSAPRLVDLDVGLNSPYSVELFPMTLTTVDFDLVFPRLASDEEPVNDDVLLACVAREPVVGSCRGRSERLKWQRLQLRLALDYVGNDGRAAPPLDTSAGSPVQNDKWFWYLPGADAAQSSTGTPIDIGRCQEIELRAVVVETPAKRDDPEIVTCGRFVRNVSGLLSWEVTGPTPSCHGVATNRGDPSDTSHDLSFAARGDLPNPPPEVVRILPEFRRSLFVKDYAAEGKIGATLRVMRGGAVSQKHTPKTTERDLPLDKDRDHLPDLWELKVTAAAGLGFCESMTASQFPRR